MTVIRPNSISGVTSITAHSQSIEFYKSDGNLSGANLDGVNINTAGILTAANFKTGSSNLHSTGLTVGNNFLHTTGINVGTGATIHVPSSNVLTLGTNSNERIRINSNGAIGLGGATYGSSGQVLTSAGSGSIPTWTTISGTTINTNADNRIITGSGTANTLNGEANLTFDGNDLSVTGTAPAINLIDTDSDDYKIENVQGVLKITDTTASADRFVINDNGTGYFLSNFQIGSTTSSPGATLHVKTSYPSLKVDSGGHASDAYVRIISGNAQNSRVDFGDTDDDNIGIINYDHGTNAFQIRTNGASNSVVITNEGEMQLSGNANPVLSVNRGGSNTTNINIKYNGSTRAQMSAASAAFEISAVGSSTPIKLFTNGSERLQIGTSGQIGLSGANYGTSGQVLTSQGSGSAPQWASAAGNTQSSYVAAPTSNNNYNFSGIPSSAYRVIINYYNISSNSQSYLYSRVGHSGGYQTSGYKYIIGYHYYDVTDSTKTDYSNRAPLFTTNWDSGSYKWAGFQQFDKIYASGSQNAWLINTHTVENTGNGWNRLLFHGRGIVEMGSNTLDRVQLHTSSGNFDSGYIKVDYYT